MGELGLDEGVFGRSLAARSALGGLSTATADVLDLLEAFGFDRILVETVGVGQNERDVKGIVECVVLVLMPGQGDSIQGMKAGVTEIADLFVVNKSELDGADRLARDLREAVELRPPRADSWTPPVLATSADTGRGVDVLLQSLNRHHELVSLETRSGPGRSSGATYRSEKPAPSEG
jgi:LAO/AO transport system kinase